MTSSSISRASRAACERGAGGRSLLPPAMSPRRPEPAAQLPRAWSYCSGPELLLGSGNTAGSACAACHTSAPQRAPSASPPARELCPGVRRPAAPAVGTRSGSTREGHALCPPPASPSSQTRSCRRVAGAPRRGPSSCFLALGRCQPASFGS